MVSWRKVKINVIPFEIKDLGSLAPVDDKAMIG